jgi:hypothetical protein
VITGGVAPGLFDRGEWIESDGQQSHESPTSPEVVERTIDPGEGQFAVRETREGVVPHLVLAALLGLDLFVDVAEHGDVPIGGPVLVHEGSRSGQDPAGGPVAVLHQQPGTGDVLTRDASAVKLSASSWTSGGRRSIPERPTTDSAGKPVSRSNDGDAQVTIASSFQRTTASATSSVTSRYSSSRSAMVRSVSKRWVESRHV